ncbi:MAG: hypothetical protein GXP62_01655, partial [Oligoflexia bacterium]|nr:hypothetical protein [Oligoflexia bacterium]
MFARLDMPAQATVLFESASPDDPDRSSGWRFYLDQSGCYYLARNHGGLFIDSARLDGDDPALYWNEPFPT